MLDYQPLILETVYCKVDVERIKRAGLITRWWYVWKQSGWTGWTQPSDTKWRWDEMHMLLFTPSLPSPSSSSLWSTSSSNAKCPWSVARCHAQRMMTVKMDDKMIRMARWPGYDKMTQARVLLINPLPCLALSPPCHLARSAGRPQKTPGKKHWHGQVGRKERNLLRNLCNLFFPTFC